MKENSQTNTGSTFVIDIKIHLPDANDNVFRPQRSPASQPTPVEIATGPSSSGRSSNFNPSGVQRGDASQPPLAPQSIPAENATNVPLLAGPPLTGHFTNNRETKGRTSSTAARSSRPSRSEKPKERSSKEPISQEMDPQFPEGENHPLSGPQNAKNSHGVSVAARMQHSPAHGNLSPFSPNIVHDVADSKVPSRSVAGPVLNVVEKDPVKDSLNKSLASQQEAQHQAAYNAKASASFNPMNETFNYNTSRHKDSAEDFTIVSPVLNPGTDREVKAENPSPYVGPMKRMQQFFSPSNTGSLGVGNTNEPASYVAALAAHKKSNEIEGSETDASSIRKGTSWKPTLPFSLKLFKASKPSSPQASKTDVDAKDVVIAVMGRVGPEGKRSFIDDAFGDGHDRQDTSSNTVHFVVARDPVDPSRNVFLVYTTGYKDQKFTDALRCSLNWLSESCGDKRKFSGLIYLEDSTTPPPSKFSRNALDLLDRCLERQNNIVVATTGWEDDVDTKPLEDRHKELIEQWRTFVDRGVGVLRLAASGKTSRDVSHSSWDVVKQVITRTDENVTVTKRSLWRAREKKADDKFLEDPRDTDIVIPVMGPTGAGKSTFINRVAGQAVTVVGHNLRSETAQLQHVILPHPTDRTRRIIIVDTPGFDDTYVADSEILRRIAVWLAASYSANMTLAGVIYLHEISQTRMLGTARKNLDMFNKLIGESATKNVVLATTKWGDIPDEVGARREEQLRERHWKWMIDLGAKLYRFTDSREAGWAIIQHILDQVATQDVDTVEIQQELVEVKKLLPETEAGQALLYTLEELLETQRQAAAQLRKDESSDQAKAIMLETRQKMRATLKQIDDLSGNRVRAWLKRSADSSRRWFGNLLD
ncbi:hypothetical protein H0H92_008960 [Tricholoma furcatifolium]|nr:hypothetical protein H0H92_008960 [Tricholoma furcatifolium]